MKKKSLSEAKWWELAFFVVVICISIVVVLDWLFNGNGFEQIGKVLLIPPMLIFATIALLGLTAFQAIVLGALAVIIVLLIFVWGTLSDGLRSLEWMNANPPRPRPAVIRVRRARRRRARPLTTTTTTEHPRLERIADK